MALKLFVWNKPYHVMYGQSMVFAVAETLDEAREQARKGDAYCYGEYEDPGAPRAIELGEPTRVSSLPCAEWHKWSE